MANKPAIKPEWATVDTIGADALNNVVEPSPGKKVLGWNFLEKPPRQWQNWLHRITNDWIDYVEQELDNFAPHAQAIPDMTIEVDHGRVNGIIKAGQTTTDFVAPSGDPRRDRVSIDAATGIYAITAGAEAASPVAPSLPVGHLYVCQILLYVGMTEITDDDIDIKERGIETLLAGGSITGSLNLEAQDAGAIGLSFFNTDTGNTATDGFFIGITATEIAQLWNFENTDLQIGTNNLERLKIEANGSVHIGAGLTGQGVGTVNALGVYSNDIEIKTPDVVTGFAGAQNISFFDGDAVQGSAINLTSLLTVSGTFESFGPTGSGADNIWAELDDIPLSAKHVLVTIDNEVTGATTSTAYSRAVNVRKGDGTFSYSPSLVRFFNNSGSTEIIESVVFAIIPLDSTNIFDCSLIFSGTGLSGSCLMYRLGWSN